MNTIKFKRVVLYCGINSTKKRIITIAHTNNQMGISICNPKERFNKKIGRDIAMGRLQNKPLTLPQNLSKLNYEEICILALTIVKSTMLNRINNFYFTYYNNK
jgi:hypothetical protein